MKKKTHHHNNAVYIGIGIFQGVILCHRRRLHLHHLLPFISAVAGCILFLFAVLSFLSPPINHDQFHSHHKVNINITKNPFINLESHFDLIITSIKFNILVYSLINTSRCVQMPESRQLFLFR